MGDAPLWDDFAAEKLLPLVGDASADVCVVGLGGSGLSCVHELLSLDQRVVAIDAGGVGGGAAGRNGGFLLAGLADFYHDAVSELGRERALLLYRRSMAELDRITAEVPELVQRNGSVRIADDAAELADCALQHAAMVADGLPVERYRGPEGEGLLFPFDGAFNPLERCRTLARRAIDSGARLFETTPALGLATGQVTTPRGIVRARHVIIAVDGGLVQLFPELSPMVRNARLQMLGTAPAPEVDFPRPVYRRWGYDYWQQLPDRRVVLGGRRDQFVEAEWTGSRVVTADLQEQLDSLLRNQLGVTAEVTHRWAGIVGYSRTGLPIVSEVRPRLWAIGGYNGTGNVVGAICGRGVARLAVRGDDSLLSGFDVGRPSNA